MVGDIRQFDIRCIIHPQTAWNKIPKIMSPSLGDDAWYVNRNIHVKVSLHSTLQTVYPRSCEDKKMESETNVDSQIFQTIGTPDSFCNQENSQLHSAVSSQIL